MPSLVGFSSFTPGIRAQLSETAQRLISDPSTRKKLDYIIQEVQKRGLGEDEVRSLFEAACGRLLIQEGRVPLPQVEETPEQQEHRTAVENARRYLDDFSEYVFGHRPEPFHLEWMQVLVDQSRKKTLIVCPPDHAKCLAEGTLVQMADGSRRPIENLKPGDNVISLDDCTLKMVFDRVHRLWEQGEQLCFRIRFKTGKELVCTADHKLRSINGWVPASLLSVGSMVAAPAAYPHNPGKDLCIDDARLLALYVAEGCRGGSFRFSNTTREIISEAEEIASRRGWYVKKYGWNFRLCSGHHKKDPNLDTPMNLLRRHGLVWLGSYQKFVPEAVFKSGNDVVSAFLNMLFACDGGVEKAGRVISYTTASERLARDVQSLLIHLGIRGVVGRKRVFYKGEARYFWTTNISDRINIERFAERVGMIGKSDDLSYLLEVVRNRRGGKTQASMLPHEWKQLLTITPYYLRKDYGLRYKEGPTSTHVVERIAGAVDDGSLRTLLDADIWWDTITSIEDMGMLPTWDIMTERNHNFVASDVLVHNSATVITLCDFLIGHNPNIHIGLLSNTATQANRKSVAIRDTIAYNPRYHEVFPHVKGDMRMRGKGWGESEWFVLRENESDPHSTLKAAGVFGPITGDRYDLLILDDVDDSENTWSAYQREKLHKWLEETAFTRLAPGGRVISIQTRWHHEDTAAWLKTQGFESMHHRVISRDDNGEEHALWQDRHPLHELVQIRSRSPLMFDRVYQGNPTPLEGSMVKEHWWQWYDPRDADDIANRATRIIQVMDTASKDKTYNDFSVILTLALLDHHAYILNVVREQLQYPQLKQLAVTQYTRFRPHAVYIESASSGIALFQDLKQNTAIPVQDVVADRSKVARLTGVLDFIASGRVLLPGVREGPRAGEAPHWIPQFLQEIAEFPLGEHDDQVDALSLAMASAFDLRPQHEWATTEFLHLGHNINASRERVRKRLQDMVAS